MACVFELDPVLADSDVVMMLRVQRERMAAAFFPSAREYSRRYGLDARRMALLGDNAIVMHPGPMNRGMEIAAEVADDPNARPSSNRSPMGSACGWPCSTSCSEEGSGPVSNPHIRPRNGQS